jgi:YHS domain-containing protein
MSKTSQPPILLTQCGDLITDLEKTPFEVYRGEKIYFCLESCRRAFLSDPERFLAGEIDHVDPA